MREARNINSFKIEVLPKPGEEIEVDGEKFKVVEVIKQEQNAKTIVQVELHSSSARIYLKIVADNP